MTRQALEWDWEILQPLAFCEYVSVSVKQRATWLVTAMQRSRPPELPRFVFPYAVLMV